MLLSILKRTLQALVVLIGVALLIFIMLRIVPGNAIITMMGEHANPEAIERMTAELGLDKPFYIQFVTYITGGPPGGFRHQLFPPCERVLPYRPGLPQHSVPGPGPPPLWPGS